MSEEKKEQEPAQLEELLKALDEEKKRSEEYLTRLKYVQADLENLKKRYERQADEPRKYANERIIIGLLGVVDELEMAVKSGRSTDSTENLAKESK